MQVPRLTSATFDFRALASARAAFSAVSTSPRAVSAAAPACSARSSSSYRVSHTIWGIKKNSAQCFIRIHHRFQGVRWNSGRYIQGFKTLFLFNVFSIPKGDGIRVSLFKSLIFTTRRAMSATQVPLPASRIYV